jgi:hypothetical protein
MDHRQQRVVVHRNYNDVNQQPTAAAIHMVSVIKTMLVSIIHWQHRSL